MKYKKFIFERKKKIVAEAMLSNSFKWSSRQIHLLSTGGYAMDLSTRPLYRECMLDGK